MINLQNKKGMTLNEIMLALLILAVTFIPTIGVISSAMRATEKDDHIIKGMALCQEKLNAVLQFPFDDIANKKYANEDELRNNQTGYVVKFGKDTIGSVDYASELVVASETVVFRVPMFDFTKLAQDKKNNNNWYKNSNWYRNVSTSRIDHLVKRYTVTVKWNEKEGGENKERFYKLSVLKANIR